MTIKKIFISLLALLLMGCSVSKVKTYKIKVKVISPTGNITQTKTVYGSQKPRVVSDYMSKDYVYVNGKEVLYLPESWTYDWEILEED